jgi:hypothetical protein
MVVGLFGPLPTKLIINIATKALQGSASDYAAYIHNRLTRPVARELSYQCHLKDNLRFGSDQWCFDRHQMYEHARRAA